ncbi:MAG: DUF4357 domain-containing protein [Clostridia bacterium]|nr:DUF4357 domain-containing protein [Clostridia bacterium]
MEDKIGYIYVLTNPSFPEYVKIGYADNVDTRIVQLNRSECTPFAFKKYAVLPVASRLADKNIHKLLDRFKPELRAKENVNGKIRVREFFAMTAQEAVEILGDIGGPYGETPQLFVEQTAEEKQDQEIAEEAAIASERKSPFSFFKCGIKEGEVITYVHDANIICTVANDREVSYNGKLTSLSALAKKLLNHKSAIQGTLHFAYKGEVLSSLRKRLEDEGRYKEIEQTETIATASAKDDNNKNGTLLYFTMEKYPATCVWSDDGFLLLKGAKMSVSSSQSCPVAIVKKREEKTTIINGERILSEDILFESGSAAAKFIAGSSINGNMYWKNEDGILLKNLQKN